MSDRLYGFKTSVYLGFLLVPLAISTWVTGLQLILPSLGPSAFALATKDDHQFNVPHRVIGGQLIAAVATAGSMWLLFGDVTVSSFHPLSILGIKLIGATFLALTVTTVGQYTVDLQHPPAFATVLVFSIGALSSAVQLLYFGLSVVILVGLHELAKRYGPWELPYDDWR